MKLNRNSKFFTESILVGIAVLIVIAFTLLKYKKGNEIKENYKVTSGKIVRYFSGGVDLSRSIVYSYEINDKEHFREIIVNYRFEICNDFSQCKDKRYWVIYSPKNPENSLINLEIEIQGVENPKFPDNLDDFK